MLRIFKWHCAHGSSLESPVVRREAVWSSMSASTQGPPLSPSAWVFTVFDLLTNFVTGEKRCCVEHLSISNFSLFPILVFIWVSISLCSFQWSLLLVLTTFFHLSVSVIWTLMTLDWKKCYCSVLWLKLFPLGYPEYPVSEHKFAASWKIPNPFALEQCVSESRGKGPVLHSQDPGSWELAQETLL